MAYGDVLAAFGNAQTVEIPPDLTVGGGIANTNNATAKAPLGTLYRYKGNLYRYVKFDNGQGDVAAVAQGVAHWKSLDPSVGTFTVTSDYTDALANINSVAGILLNAVTDLYYTWIQVSGYVAAKVGASTAIGDVMIGGSTDVTFARLAADAQITSVPFAVAHSAINTPTTGQSYVRLLGGVLASF